ncbi:L,D-transpeptidase [Variovorax sp. PAMC 28711]|uniref:L,D-transpeptidase n=1 Tax=Variovorax sp. PAMC 28711 TaxID=1795631 RepID=UPI000A721E0F|nr:L,D-transpeptidase [Variovorax sp. PAMC 28711]
MQAILVYWFPVGETASLIGASPVSTGRVGQYDHFETPLGVFDHATANPDFRAEGTVNAFGFRGYGAKGMRVYDLGWQQATRGWGKGGESAMRLQMHATDPVLAESKLGSVQSKGCIRIPATLNWLLDHFGVLDADYAGATSDGNPRWVLQDDRQPVPDAGRYLVVVDSLREARAVWSPAPP